MSPVYLAENGITVKARDWAGIGAKGMLNGVEYTVVDRGMIEDMYDSDSDHRVEDMTTFCTTRLTNLEDDAEFYFGDVFNQDISTWDVSNVTNMYGMFSGASSFNQDLSAWDVSNVTDMNYMFENATSFNQDLSAWDVRNVTNMSSMFQNASSFNQDLSAWDVSNVTNMNYMFSYAQNFNQDLSAWDVSNVTTMSRMFYNAQYFNQDLSSWDVNNVLGFNDFDAETPSWTLPKPNFISPFYLDANGITVKAKEGTPIGAKGLLNGVEYTVVDSYMLSNRIRNGEDVTKVCTSRVEYMDGGMFHEHFNQDLSSWDVSNVTSMNGYVLQCTILQPRPQCLGCEQCDKYAIYVLQCTRLQSRHQFLGCEQCDNYEVYVSVCTSFNQDLSAWDVSNVQEYWDFNSNAYQWTLPKPNFKITNVSFISTASGDGTKIIVTPTSNSIEGTSYSIDFNDPAAADGEDIKASFGTPIMYDYPNEDATYTITVTASNGMESETYSASVTVTYREWEASLLIGEWVMWPNPGAMMVASSLDPEANGNWWANSIQDVGTRSCLFDDKYVFNDDNSFKNDLGDSTWTEFDGTQCVAPFAPYDGSIIATWIHDTEKNTVQLNGQGSYLGVKKVANGVELADATGAPSSRTYDILSLTENVLSLRIAVDNTAGLDGENAYWYFILARVGSEEAEIPQIRLEMEMVYWTSMMSAQKKLEH